MSFYKKIAEVGSKYIGKSTLFKYGFNLSPMYRRSTARITDVSDDLLKISIKLPISYKNKNYVNSIFGGSMFSAVDPIPMVQLINLIGEDFVVWDKSAEISFKRPAKEDLYADFIYTMEELSEIRTKVGQENEIEIVKITTLTDKAQTKVYCEVKKTIYIASKSYYKKKREKLKKKFPTPKSLILVNVITLKKLRRLLHDFFEFAIKVRDIIVTTFITNLSDVFVASHQ